MKSIKTVLLPVLLLLTLMTSVAFAADVEIVFPNVNFRKTPGGPVLRRFAGGEVLNATDEVWRNDQLWYRLSSEEFGEGYVSAVYARPVWQGRTLYDSDSPDYVSAAITENMPGFLEEWIGLHFEYGFCFWDDELGGRHYPEMNEAERKVKSAPECRIRLADMLFRYGLIWETDDHAFLNDPERPEEEKAEIASRVLINHYGTDDIYLIIRSCYGNDIPASDWHSPIPPVETDADYFRYREAVIRVENRYGRTETDRDEGVPQSLKNGCYINPNGGTKLHADPNCPGVSPKYLPLTKTEYSDDLIGPYMFCPVCCGGLARPAETISPETELFLNPPYTEAELDQFTKEWEKQYGDYRFWKLDTRLAYEVQYGTIPGNCWNNTTLSCAPDDHEMTEEEAISQAFYYIPLYDGRYSSEYLKSLKMGSDHRKMKSDIISENGSWLLSFYDCSGPEPVIMIRCYIDGHTGVPDFCWFAPNVSYKGAPGESSAQYDD